MKSPLLSGDYHPAETIFIPMKATACYVTKQSAVYTKCVQQERRIQMPHGKLKSVYQTGRYKPLTAGPTMSSKGLSK